MTGSRCLMSSLSWYGIHSLFFFITECSPQFEKVSQQFQTNAALLPLSAAVARLVHLIIMHGDVFIHMAVSYDQLVYHLLRQEANLATLRASGTYLCLMQLKTISKQPCCQKKCQRTRPMPLPRLRPRSLTTSRNSRLSSATLTSKSRPTKSCTAQCSSPRRASSKLFAIISRDCNSAPSMSSRTTDSTKAPPTSSFSGQSCARSSLAIDRVG